MRTELFRNGEPWQWLCKFFTAGPDSLVASNMADLVNDGGLNTPLEVIKAENVYRSCILRTVRNKKLWQSALDYLFIVPYFVEKAKTFTFKRRDVLTRYPSGGKRKWQRSAFLVFSIFVTVRIMFKRKNWLQINKKSQHEHENVKVGRNTVNRQATCSGGSTGKKFVRKSKRKNREQSENWHPCWHTHFFRALDKNFAWYHQMHYAGTAKCLRMLSGIQCSLS